MFLFSILITGLTFVSQDNGADEVNSTLNVSSKFQPLILQNKALTPHDPIIIIGDSELIAYGFPGDGSPTLPYIIDGYSIINSSITDGIVVENTTKHFKITNCYVEVNNDGIRIRNLANGTAIIANNHIIGGANAFGILVVNSDNTIVANNSILECNTGLRISDCSGLYAYNNTFIGGSPVGYICSAGIYPSKSSNVFLINNTIDDFNRGIYTLEVTSSLFANNTILSSKEYGGIYLGENSDYNTIINNTILHNSAFDGIRLYKSEFNDISYNTVKFNTGYGCNLGIGASSNIVHHNNFILNNFPNSQGYSGTIHNLWYQPNINEEGNYWFDWNGSGSYETDGFHDLDFYPLNSPTVMNWTGFVFSPFPDDVFEDNDNLEDAPEIVLGKKFYLIYNDIDYFRFTLNATYNIEVKLEFDYPTINLDLFLLPDNFTGSSDDILASSEETITSETITYEALASGVYFLLVECSDETFILQDYRLSVLLTGLLITQCYLDFSSIHFSYLCYNCNI